MTTDNLIERKSDTHHYYQDEYRKRQGEYKRWYTNGQLSAHYFYVNGRRHGEYKTWWKINGQLRGHYIYINGKQTDIPIPTTDEDRFALVLEHGHMEFIKA